MNSAKEFRKIWQQQNPKVIHIPSEHELGLMEAYALYVSQEKCREQREACADEIAEEEKDDQLIYSQTEAIRSLVKQTPLVTTKTDKK